MDDINFNLDFDINFNIFFIEYKRHPDGWYKYHNESRKLLKDKCESCGYEDELQAHHIDQNYMNNTLENIQTLCKYCHQFWHKVAKRLNKDISGKMPVIVINS
jgi:hypothetical protein